jgi:hypothetical protein
LHWLFTTESALFYSDKPFLFIVENPILRLANRTGTFLVRPVYNQ